MCVLCGLPSLLPPQADVILRSPKGCLDAVVSGKAQGAEERRTPPPPLPLTPGPSSGLSSIRSRGAVRSAAAALAAACVAGGRRAA